MKSFSVIFLVIIFSGPAFSAELSGNWQLSKVICASGDAPLWNWEAWRILLKFEAPNYYTLIRQREEFTSFETGDFYAGDAHHQICFKNDFSSEWPAKCYDVILEDRLLRFGEYMQTDGDCIQGDYSIRYFLSTSKLDRSLNKVLSANLDHRHQ